MKKTLIIITCLILLSFSTGDYRSEYNVPLLAWSVTAGDIDLDGDNDIVVGHNYSTKTHWSGVSILLNDNNGYFELYDSIYLYAGQSNVLLENLNILPNKEIIANYIDSLSGIKFLAIINDFDPTDIIYFTVNTEEAINYKTTGDINGDGEPDIVIASNKGQYWGVLYNDGTGNFSNPQYNQVSFDPNDVAVNDLNNDGRDDIVVCGQKTEIFFSYPDGFQEMDIESEYFFIKVYIVDFNEDGLKDIIGFDDIFGTYTQITIFKNIDGTNFERLPYELKQPGAHVYFITDFNNDTLPDILLQLANFSGYKIYYNKGNFQLGDSLFVPIPFYGEGWRNCYCADMDGNGYQDIITIRASNAQLPANLDIRFNNGEGDFVENPLSSIENYSSPIDKTFSCYPNPFQNRTTFEFKTEKNEMAELYIYNLQGRLITCLTKSVKKGGQINYLKWDGLDTGGKPCKPGPYLAYLKVNGKIKKTVKLIITK